jgi:glycosyltransferase involved in cell wall biosynthesis
MAKVVHDNLNAGGGSERLAVATIQALNELGFMVDVETCTPLEIKNLNKFLGPLDLTIRQLKKLDILSLLRSKQAKIDSDDGDNYDLVINTHGDLLPYFYQDYTNNPTGMNTFLTEHKTVNKKGTLMVTYCHYPLVPYLVENGDYKRFLYKYIKISNDPRTSLDSFSHYSVIDKLLSNGCLLYDLMMRNTVVLTNSEFSKRAIKQLYNNDVQPIILSPPVDVKAFRNVALCTKEGQREDTILVVSRFSPDKKVENAIRIAKVLSDRKTTDYKMIIIGSICNAHDDDYLLFLKNMIHHYDLHEYIKLEIGPSFDKLVHLMSKSKIYLHPLAGEPFGISVAEAMAAGLIPVVPCLGGNSEFVPQRYHYRTLEEAATLIEDALQSRPVDNQFRTRLSNLTLRFSIENYKYGLKKIISTLITKPKQTPLLGSQ